MQVLVRTIDTTATMAMKPFLQLRSPTFQGELDPLVAENWLEQIMRVLDTILVTGRFTSVVCFVSITRGRSSMVEDRGGECGKEVGTIHGSFPSLILYEYGK